LNGAKKKVRSYQLACASLSQYFLSESAEFIKIVNFLQIKTVTWAIKFKRNFVLRFTVINNYEPNQLSRFEPVIVLLGPLVFVLLK